MQKRRMVSTTFALALGAMLVNTSPGLAEETVCTGTIGPVTLDNIVVPSGYSCSLNGTRAQGTVLVQRGATLSASGVSVHGNIQADGARAVYINPGSFVGGNIQIKQGGSARLDRAIVDGDVQLESNFGPLRATRNDIGGNMQIFQNTGGVTLWKNLIAENLQCKENFPPPVGGGNSAGHKEDQCAKL